MSDERKTARVIEWLRERFLSRMALPLVIVGILVLLLALMFPRVESVRLETKIGTVWAQKDLIAPFSFPILREEREYARDVEEARRKVYPVFERDTQAVAGYTVRIRRFFAQAGDALSSRAEAKRSARLHLPEAAQDSSRFAERASKLDLLLTDREWDLLAFAVAAKRVSALELLLISTGHELLQQGILDRQKGSLATGTIALRHGTIEELIPSEQFLDQNDVVALYGKRVEDRLGRAESMSDLVYKIGITHLSPNIRFNEAATQQAIAAAADNVVRTLGFVQENERIISKHERVTADTRLRLESYHRAWLDRGSAADTPLHFLGNVLHVGVVLLLFSIYLRLFRQRIVNNPRQLALIAFLLLLIGVLAFVTRELDVEAPIEYLIVVPAISMLLTIIFDSRVGFYGTVTAALIVAGIRGNDYSVALGALVAGALAVYSVRDMRNRSQIFRSLLFIFLGYALVVVSLAFERSDPVALPLEQLAFALGNAVVSPVLTYGLLIFLERVFKVTTDLTLIELGHFNHPLLRLLAEKAPGTHHHSMTMASLTEAGAAAIGANDVLARVAAYFHDVGKVVKPTYFVENQRGSRNRHDKLSPRMSSLIIAAHVKDGIALAREYGLPQEIVDFIPMHHGTTRIDYFYNKAVKLAEGSEDETKIDEINEQDYRYPGPKPQTKETGIMMLADAIEATVRTVEDPIPQRLEGIINDIVRRRFEEGELDECPLTVKDLTKIKVAFLNILVGVYHTRVKYPDPPRKRARKSEFAEKAAEAPGNGSPPQAPPPEEKAG